MLRITLEATTLDAASLGIETVGTLEIRNDGTGTPDLGNYVWGLKNASGTVRDHGRLLDYPRDQGAWRLVGAVLCQLQAPATLTRTEEARRQALGQGDAMPEPYGQGWLQHAPDEGGE